MEHTQYILFALQYLYTRRLNQVQLILIPAAACMFLEMFVFIAILKICKPGQIAVTMFQQQDQAIRSADAFHFLQCLDWVWKSAPGQRGDYRGKLASGNSRCSASIIARLTFSPYLVAFARATSNLFRLRSTAVMSLPAGNKRMFRPVPHVTSRILPVAFDSNFFLSRATPRICWSNLFFILIGDLVIRILKFACGHLFTDGCATRGTRLSLLPSSKGMRSLGGSINSIFSFALCCCANPRRDYDH